MVDTKTVSNNIIQSKPEQRGPILCEQEVLVLFTDFSTKQNLITASGLLLQERPASFESKFKSA
jgi:hypothetical protein